MQRKKCSLLNVRRKCNSLNVNFHRILKFSESTNDFRKLIDQLYRTFHKHSDENVGHEFFKPAVENNERRMPFDSHN